ncbi:hypothetical protein SAMN05443144_102154 [Fodinibius roseus]|uniref:Uncharacterized protein n=1 Tax=Fodinibius roseus TaxID=1194090 RepID=A0A1M4UY99_9BACT|nr:hypothetical protein SAMN05443144_102154 [Fodinibius roseus]
MLNFLPIDRYSDQPSFGQLTFCFSFLILSIRVHGNDGLVMILSDQLNIAMAFLFPTHLFLQKLVYTASTGIRLSNSSKIPEQIIIH